MDKFLELPYETLSIFSFIISQIIIDNMDIDHQNTLINILFLIASFVRLKIGQQILLEAITAENLENKVNQLIEEIQNIKKNLNI